ncbi:hypothetical protein KCP69_05255 [Salmonella enterica subsp. enterica]|nr:hypothetical protein KCP69_05255 [Salmonella enterica subsp. enterica]
MITPSRRKEERFAARVVIKLYRRSAYLCEVHHNGIAIFRRLACAFSTLQQTGRGFHAFKAVANVLPFASLSASVFSIFSPEQRSSRVLRKRCSVAHFLTDINSALIGKAFRTPAIN